MDDINGAMADSSGVAGSRYSLRSEKNKFLHGNDDNYLEEHSTIDHDDNGSSNSDNDPPLSEYELLRLRKIKRNEARLAQLGLLVPPAAAAAKSSNNRQSGDNAGETTTSSALTTLLLASPAQTSKKKKRKKKQDDTTITTEPLPRRIFTKEAMHNLTMQ